LLHARSVADARRARQCRQRVASQWPTGRGWWASSRWLARPPAAAGAVGHAPLRDNDGGNGSPLAAVGGSRRHVGRRAQSPRSDLRCLRPDLDMTIDDLVARTDEKVATLQRYIELDLLPDAEDYSRSLEAT